MMLACSRGPLRGIGLIFSCAIHSYAAGRLDDMLRAKLHRADPYV